MSLPLVKIKHTSVLFSICYSEGVNLGCLKNRILFMKCPSLDHLTVLGLNVNRNECYFKITCSSDCTKCWRLCGIILGNFPTSRLPVDHFSEENSVLKSIALYGSEIPHLDINPRKSGEQWCCLWP